MNSPFSSITSNTISALRFPLMVGIVFIHFGVLNGVSVQGIVYGANPPLWLKDINIMLSEVLPSISVPLFFLVSGHLFFIGGLSCKSYKKKIKKRTKTLFIPYILWNALALLYLSIKTLPCFHSIFPNGIEPDWSVQNILASFWDKTNHGVFFNPANVNLYEEHIAVPQDGPLWYVRNLMIAGLLSPIFYMFIKKCKLWGLLTLGLIWFYCDSNGIMKSSQFLTTSFFFSWGSYLTLNGKDFVESMSCFRIAPYLYIQIAFIDTMTKEWVYNGYIHNIGIILGIFSAVIITSKIGRYNKFLSESSFFLFASHMIFINDVAKVILKLYFIDSPLYMALLYFAVPCVTIGICLGLYWLLKKNIPIVVSVLNGGR